MLKIIAWNVNGIRSLLKTENLDNLINHEDPDILCFGETKISCPYNKIEDEFNKRYEQYKYNYWSPCIIRGGYSGTAIFSKIKPINVSYGISDIDNEGRVITAEFKKFYLVHVYTPNSGEKLLRLEWRVKTWDKHFREFILELQKTKPVILCGDLNVARNPIDLANPQTNLRSAGFTTEERESFEKLITETKLIDSFRYITPDRVLYSYWSYMRNSRNKNIGWRIDYFMVDKKLIKKIIESTILTHIMGSDHAPVKIIIKNN